MSNVLLIDLAIDSPIQAADNKLKYPYLQKRPKLGLQYLCSALESRKMHCEIMDQLAMPFSLRELVLKIKNGKFIFIGFYSHFLIKNKIISCIRQIKNECNLVIAVGGPGSIYKDEFIKNGCDIVCHGEGERTILQIAEYAENKISAEEIKGISYKNASGVITNGTQDLIENLDEISFPDREKIDLNFYYDYYITPRKPYASMITSRGCPFKCAFCIAPMLWNNRYRFRSVRNVLDEISLLVKKYGVKYIAFQDDIFGHNDEWLNEFCRGLSWERFDLKWSCFLHPLSLKKKKQSLIASMKKAGCNLIHFGIQSANQEILKRINRNPTEPALLEESVRMAKKQGILTLMEFILGLPGETEESLRENLRYALKVKPHLTDFHPLVLFTGSEIEVKFRSRPVCALSGDEVRRWCSISLRNFYLRPDTLARISGYVIKNNPRWILKLPYALKFIFDFLGFKKNDPA